VALDVQAKEFLEEIAAIRANVTRAKKHGTFYETRWQTEANKREPQARLEAVEARAQLGRVQGVCASAVQPPIFNGNTSWAVFRGQFRTVAEHNCWMRQEKYTYLITSLQCPATEVLHGIPKRATYEETLQNLEERFGDQQFAAAFHSQLNTKTQRAEESLQDFATAVEQLAHRAYPTLPEDQIRREAGKAFGDGVENQAIKTSLSIGGEKMVSKVLR
jgi:hypothetical protein